MNRPLVITFFGALFSAVLSAQTPTQELKPPPPPPPTAPVAPATAQDAPRDTHTPFKPLPETPATATATSSAAGAPSLSFASGNYKFLWDTTLPLGLDVDGLKVKDVFFNVRRSRYSWLKEAEFGTRAHVTVTNTSARPRVPGFAVAVLDADGKLIGVASGGTKVGTVDPGETEEFDLNFTQVKERLQKGATFLLSVELRD